MIDLAMFPFIVQLTYLGCNRRNLNLLVSSFEINSKFKNFLRFYLWRSGGSVYPDTVESGWSTEMTNRF
uniref:Uncharacterized protein n=1 Tax=Caenorhabditis tropicalis TaxID=1561998 RepID=A0A1I7V3D9_9PELO